MEIVAPDTAKNILPEGTVLVEFAKDQPEYRMLPAFVTPDGKVLSQWKPTPGDLALLNNGVPVTLVVWHGELTDENRLRPVMLAVGGVNLKEER